MKNCHIPGLVVWFLGSFSILGLVGTIYLTANKADASSVAIVSGLCGTAVGAVAGILSQTNRTQEVTVTNPPSDPVNVEQK